MPEIHFSKQPQFHIETEARAPSGVPLIVLLDDSLLVSNPLSESVAALIGERPAMLLVIPVWLLKGCAHLKQQLSSRGSLNASLLPYHEEFWEWLKKERCRRTSIYMVTSAGESDARAIAEHLGVFDGFVPNYKHAGQSKTGTFSHRSGIFDEVFDYAGSSFVRSEMWSKKRSMFVFTRKSAGPQTYASALRLNQWPKNLLIFVPLITSHQLHNLQSVGSALLATAVFSLCASSVYVLNDLADLASDRKHLIKRHRAFASGRLSLSTGPVLLILALSAAAALSLFLTPSFRLVLCGYLVLTWIYSVWLKRVVLIDVFVLAALYTSRLVAGSSAYGIELSNWLLSFSMFLFLSLGYCKRAAELLKMRGNSQHTTPGRGYLASDFEQVTMFGVSSGFVSSLVLPIYIQSNGVSALYRKASLLWLLFPLLLYWISRMWMLTSRGTMNEDPVYFAVRDRVTWIIAAISALVMFAAT